MHCRERSSHVGWYPYITQVKLYESEQNSNIYIEREREFRGWLFFFLRQQLYRSRYSRSKREHRKNQELSPRVTKRYNELIFAHSFYRLLFNTPRQYETPTLLIARICSSFLPEIAVPSISACQGDLVCFPVYYSNHRSRHWHLLLPRKEEKKLAHLISCGELKDSQITQRRGLRAPGAFDVKLMISPDLSG